MDFCKCVDVVDEEGPLRLTHPRCPFHSKDGVMDWLKAFRFNGKGLTQMATLINDPVMGAIVTEILNEVNRSKAKHPNYPTDPLRQTAITLEESIEAVHEWIHLMEQLQNSALHVARVGNEEKFKTLEDLKKELIHAGAMVVKQLESLVKEGV